MNRGARSGAPKQAGAGLLIAIDGPAGSGKTTVAAAVARRLGLRRIETGAMYRALALKARLNNVAVDDPEAVSGLLSGTIIEPGDDRVLLDGRDVAPELRTAELSDAASRIARIPQVRNWMAGRQRSLALAEPPGAVLEGRDIGTVVLPDAALKIFLTAGPEERARRRAGQSGQAIVVDVLEEMAARDRRDAQREVAPLVAASDAIEIDSTGMSVEQVVERIVDLAGAVLR